MRVIREMSHSLGRITIFAWNNRYLIKIEQGYLEQTYKIDSLDVSSDDELLKLIDEKFLQQVDLRFREMGQSLHDARQRCLE
jgi:hypothetical protein